MLLWYHFLCTVRRKSIVALIVFGSFFSWVMKCYGTLDKKPSKCSSFTVAGRKKLWYVYRYACAKNDRYFQYLILDTLSLSSCIFSLESTHILLFSMWNFNFSAQSWKVRRDWRHGPHVWPLWILFSRCLKKRNYFIIVRFKAYSLFSVQHCFSWLRNNATPMFSGLFFELWMHFYPTCFAWLSKCETENVWKVWNGNCKTLSDLKINNWAAFEVDFRIAELKEALQINTRYSRTQIVLSV